MTCMTVQGIIDDAETKVMQRALEEGLSPEYARALFNLRRMGHHDSSMKVHTVLEGLGYEQKSNDFLDFCSLYPGTPCFPREMEYEQYRKGDDAVVLIKKTLRETVDISGSESVTCLTNIKDYMIWLYYIGDSPEGLKAGPGLVRCSETGELCSSAKRAYSVGKLIIDVFYGMHDDRTYEKYMKIAREEEERAGEEISRVRKGCSSTCPSCSTID